ncbi:MAG: ABC transporter permease [Geodermatophilaceae bacterium]|nr:ABC transporter permease [Geodermatophilaceae bacterium]MDQ3457512.1 ABC transporter permease [Actinomycetota bacterium]
MAATTARGVPVTRARGPVVRALARPELGAVIAAVLIAGFFATRTDQFATAAGLANVLDVTATLGIMAVAVALLLIGGEFDLSAGALTASTGLVTALLVNRLEVNIWEGIVWSLVFALAVGFVNGLVVTLTRLPGFIVTLGTLFALTGANVGVTKLLTDTVRVGAVDEAAGYDSARAVFASSVTVEQGEFRVAILWWLGVTVVATGLLVRTKFGNWIFGVGGGAASARSAGVPVRRTKILLFMGTATAAWLVGTISLLRLTSVQADAGLGEEFTYIIAAVIGGCLITGGAGSAWGAALGALIYGMTQQGIVFAQWDSDWFPLVLGGMLLAAVFINTLFVRRR